MGLCLNIIVLTLGDKTLEKNLNINVLGLRAKSRAPIVKYDSG